MSSQRNEIDTGLAEIGDMLKREQDESTRGTLLIMYKMMTTLSIIQSGFDTKTDDHATKLVTHDEMLVDHERLINQGKSLVSFSTWLLSLIQAVVIGIGIYGYTLIADLRDCVKSQAVVIPRIEIKVDELSTRLDAQSAIINRGNK